MECSSSHSPRFCGSRLGQPELKGPHPPQHLAPLPWPQPALAADLRPALRPRLRDCRGHRLRWVRLWFSPAGSSHVIAAGNTDHDDAYVTKRANAGAKLLASSTSGCLTDLVTTRSADTTVNHSVQHQQDFNQPCSPFLRQTEHTDRRVNDITACRTF